VKSDPIQVRVVSGPLLEAIGELIRVRRWVAPGPLGPVRWQMARLACSVGFLIRLPVSGLGWHGALVESNRPCGGVGWMA